MTLQKGAKRLYEWLKERHSGEIYDAKTIMDIADWSESSLKTYLSKNKLAPFLRKLANGKIEVLLNGDEITERFFHETFTQTAPKKVNLSTGSRVRGENGIYELIDPIGNGAVGHVWSAKLEGSTTDLVALKIMQPREDLLAESKISDVRERFRRESEYGPSLKHSNIIRYLDFGDIYGNPFLVMEKADESISKKLERDGKLNLNLVNEIMVSCIVGLEYLHNKGCIHRDVKPSNMLRFHDSYKLGDLGIVKWTDFDETITKGGTITRASMQLGSWFYMAPEQQEDPHEAVPASDIYALAVSWIEMLTGLLPSPQAIGANAYKFPNDCEDIRIMINRMLSYNPEDRPALMEIKSVLN